MLVPYPPYFSPLFNGAGNGGPPPLSLSSVDPDDESQWRSLYVGNLPLTIIEENLFEIFGRAGPVSHCKIIKEKSTGKSLGYGFVDYFDHEAAVLALESFNSYKILEHELKVNWAHVTSHAHTLFVGDLSGEVTEQMLTSAFSSSGDVTDSRVMMDANTGRSRGFGFVSFRSKGDAEKALRDMNGEWVGSRAIRVNWANQKNHISHHHNTPSTPNTNTYGQPVSDTNTSVYIGNLPHSLTENDVLLLVSDFAPHIEQVRLHKGYAFIHFKTHEQAKEAIHYLPGRTIIDRQIKCGWGKERGGSG
eukprot:CAMPEP_0201511964 /NCGR_PEP_ID=MMETSP0161_2-20130828/4324_1 /ASSEMBLY_ACC=CAM_ASM_000251 /TAXON_ID=180227 /ORGANISM="Neoparamoeba aestuarina, Strain SoJaBio B1-5/56/2" /LENGTH=303 /DNA_ID=CAMNT_0047907645 /DNA_START=246 /DNA_END=1153 /DNA_ORIENTATION=+